MNIVLGVCHHIAHLCRGVQIGTGELSDIQSGITDQYYYFAGGRGGITCYGPQVASNPGGEQYS